MADQAIASTADLSSVHLTYNTYSEKLDNIGNVEIHNPHKLQLSTKFEKTAFKTKEEIRDFFVNLTPEDVGNIRIEVARHSKFTDTWARTNLDGLVTMAEAQCSGEHVLTFEIASKFHCDSPAVLWKRREAKDLTRALPKSDSHQSSSSTES